MCKTIQYKIVCVTNGQEQTLGPKCRPKTRQMSVHLYLFRIRLNSHLKGSQGPNPGCQSRTANKNLAQALIKNPNTVQSPDTRNPKTQGTPERDRNEGNWTCMISDKEHTEHKDLTTQGGWRYLDTPGRGHWDTGETHPGNHIGET